MTRVISFILLFAVGVPAVCSAETVLLCFVDKVSVDGGELQSLSDISDMEYLEVRYSAESLQIDSTFFGRRIIDKMWLSQCLPSNEAKVAKIRITANEISAEGTAVHLLQDGSCERPSTDSIRISRTGGEMLWTSLLTDSESGEIQVRIEGRCMKPGWKF